MTVESQLIPFYAGVNSNMVAHACWVIEPLHDNLGALRDIVARELTLGAVQHYDAVTGVSVGINPVSAERQQLAVLPQQQLTSWNIRGRDFNVVSDHLQMIVGNPILGWSSEGGQNPIAPMCRLFIVAFFGETDPVLPSLRDMGKSAFTYSPNASTRGVSFVSHGKLDKASKARTAKDQDIKIPKYKVILDQVFQFKGTNTEKGTPFMKVDVPLPPRTLYFSETIGSITKTSIPDNMRLALYAYGSYCVHQDDEHADFYRLMPTINWQRTVKIQDPN